MSGSWRWFVPAAAAVVLTLVSATGSVRAQRGSDMLAKGEWPEYAGDTRGMKYSPRSDQQEQYPRPKGRLALDISRSRIPARQPHAPLHASRGYPADGQR